MANERIAIELAPVQHHETDYLPMVWVDVSHIVSVAVHPTSGDTVVTLSTGRTILADEAADLLALRLWPTVLPQGA